MRILFLLCLMALVDGCATRSQQESMQPPVFRPGQLVVVQFTNRPVPEVRQVVDPDGNISLPFVGKLCVAGMTTEQVQRAVLEAYAAAENLSPLEVSIQSGQ